MKKYVPILNNTQLFSGIAEEEIAAMLGCLGTRVRKYKKGEYVFRQGDPIGDITVLASGCLHIQRDDYWGSRSIINVVMPGEMFGEAFAARNGGTILNDVAAVEDAEVLFFDVNRVLTTCSSACRFHAMVVQNLFYAISEKNRKLVQKLGHMAKRTTRDKLLSYLSEEAKRQQKSEFSIPFNRQQLADYLSVDRSALSGELSKLKDEGLLDYRKNEFILYHGAQEV